MTEKKRYNRYLYKIRIAEEAINAMDLCESYLHINEGYWRQKRQFNIFQKIGDKNNRYAVSLICLEDGRLAFKVFRCSINHRGEHILLNIRRKDIPEYLILAIMINIKGECIKGYRYELIKEGVTY